MENNEVKNEQVTVVTKENKKAKEKKPWNWKSFLTGGVAGAGLLLLGATLTTMLGGGDSNENSGD